ncbi:MAG: hypothetical protein J6A96_05250 [Clostridia bacterium]|nr:hypothetical protein [Clostridia bacterium]
MRLIKFTVTGLLLCAMALGRVLPFAEALEVPVSSDTSSCDVQIGTDENSSATPLGQTTTISQFPSETNSHVANFLIDSTNQTSPFFETVLPAIAANIKENNTHSINPHFDAIPNNRPTNNQNFQGLGVSTYDNINGKTVTVEPFYRNYGESYNDPNYGMGIMIYQCIQYKLAHPEENVKITFSSYRTSATAAVCVIPESKYYGLMRSLFGTNYDEHGFVRISYMLVEAARMGIEVTMINQLPSYGTKQYNGVSGEVKTRSHIDFVQYFNEALKTECYDKYVGEDKNVSDYLDFIVVDWLLDDQTQNMQHVKHAAVSHYLATDGTEHSSAVFYSTANLDENDYLGRNGNSFSQSGVIISDHDELYRTNHNYIMLMAKYKHKEGIQELRVITSDRSEKQIALLKAGRGAEIPKDEQIVYIGSESDKIFELYFTPLGGASDAWDTDHNPVCNYTEKMAFSDDYVEFVCNQYAYGRSYFGYAVERMLEVAYCQRPNPQNKISIKIDDFDTEAINNLELGKDIGYRDIGPGVANRIHAKDFMLSYEEEGMRHYVSIMTSCNFGLVAYYYRTNSILVIHETEETGNDYYETFGQKYSYGMIGSN